MKRVCIIGCCGSGKSTLALKLHTQTAIPIIHLDQHYWKPNWTESNKAEWTKKVEELSDRPSWIIDGNYGGTMDIRFQKADTIIYLDRPTWLCVYRILKRTFLGYGKTRTDMAEGCKERFDFNFLIYVTFFNLRNRKKLLSKLKTLKPSQTVHILKNEQAITNFLAIGC